MSSKEQPREYRMDALHNAGEMWVSVGPPMSGVVAGDSLGSVCGTEATGGHFRVEIVDCSRCVSLIGRMIYTCSGFY